MSIWALYVIVRAVKLAPKRYSVEAPGCDVAALRSLTAMQAVCERVVRELELQVVGQPL